ncbi:cytochrome c3 family protein [Falsiroseomonas sp.]|uniref:cytochrome c3 family protein n=1 Tax=Falsiroseomonas sp. TaxID=2870721 RepID=UPI00356385D2
MPQIFSPRADGRFRLTLLLLVAGLLGAALLAYALARSDRAWAIGQPAPQPIPFSHALHAGNIGLDCRYCHAQVERSGNAGMPSAALCLGCHQQVWMGASILAPLHDSIELGDPIAWASVHRLPGHARFHHGVHVQAGVDCATCHGAVQTMPRTVKVHSMSMGWCLECHRAAAAMVPTANRAPDELGPLGLWHGGVELPPLTRCSTCHR